MSTPKKTTERVKCAPLPLSSRTTIKSESATRFPRSALRLPKVIERTGLSRASIYRMIQASKFPAPIKFSERVSVWDSEAIDAWFADKFGRAA